MATPTASSLALVGSIPKVAAPYSREIRKQTSVVAADVENFFPRKIPQRRLAGGNEVCKYVLRMAGTVVIGRRE
jgi:hypothetical protein